MMDLGRYRDRIVVFVVVERSENFLESRRHVLDRTQNSPFAGVVAGRLTSFGYYYSLH